MSQARLMFDAAIQDAEELLGHFDRVNTQPPPPNAEVLKRTGLIMAFTAWETYVEDRVCEALAARLVSKGKGPSARFVQRRLEEELKKFKNPSTEKTKKLFQEFLEIGVTASWTWNQYDVAKVKTTLDTLIAKRGEAAHRSSPKRGGPPATHLITRDELKKTVNFLKLLVEATEKAL